MEVKIARSGMSGKYFVRAYDEHGGVLFTDVFDTAAEAREHAEFTRQFFADEDEADELFGDASETHDSQ